MGDQKNIVNRAIEFATSAHSDQQRKYTGEPYVVHPVAVMQIVRSVDHTEEMLVAAVLHDVLEDTFTTMGEIRRAFSSKVYELVFELTKVSTPRDGNRAKRKVMDRRFLAKVSADAQTVKLADMIHNSESILEHDPKFARVYLSEQAALLAVLTRGDENLQKMMEEILERN